MEVLHDRGSATPVGVDRWTSGSGYLVGRRLVLTVAHNVQHRRDFGDDEQLLVRTIEGRVLAARVVLVCDEPSQVDLALLEISDPQFGEHLTPVTFARINRDNPAPVRGCWAVGFPRFGEAGPVLPEGSRKETWQVTGDILPGTKRRAGLLSLQVTSTPWPLPASLAGSAWEGMSGAVVFAPDVDVGELAVGVIALHHRPEGESALTVVPITALAGVPAAVDWWRLLGVADPGMLPVHPPLGVSDQLRSRLAGLVELPLIDGRLPQVAGLDPYSLGTTPSAYGNAETYGQRDEYVPRAIDESLASALHPGRLVVLVGPSKAGKTRTAFEVLRRHDLWRSALLAAPVRQSVDQLAGHSALGSAGPLVIWLDDLQRFLPPDGELSQSVISRLADRPGPTLLLATLRTEQREFLRGGDGELTREVRMVLDNAFPIELASTRDDPAEQARAAAAYPEAASGPEGLAEILAGAPELLRRYRAAATADPPLHMLVQTCVDWARCTLAGPIPELDLLAIARDALWERRADLDLSNGVMGEALRQARTPIAGGGQVALLGTRRMSGGSRGYEAFDYLVAADDGQAGGSSRLVTQATWQRFLDRATDEDATGIAFRADQRDNIPVAVEAGRRAAKAGDTEAQNLLGLVLATRLDPPELAEARTWLTQAAKAGNVEAQNSLGLLLGSILNPPERTKARTWLTRAAKAGDTAAQHNLGLLLEKLDPPELAEARIWLTRAAEAGDTQAQHSLGGLLGERLDPPELAEARIWLTRAAEAGSDRAQYGLGVLLAQQLDPPELAEARTWWTKAAEAGNTDAQRSLGWLLAQQLDPPELAEARIWYTKAAEVGDTFAQHNLGLLLKQLDPPELAEARIWLTKAAEAGDTDAQNNLGAVLATMLDPPELAEARIWLTRAAKAGNTGAQNNLGALLATMLDPPELAEARTWYTKAAEAGDTDAQNSLGWMLVTMLDPPELAEARTWWTKAAEAGNAGAQNSLGGLLATMLDPPELAEARTWWTKAAEAGDTGAQNSLGWMLANLLDPPELAEARTWYARAAEAGNTDAQVNLGVLLATMLDPPELAEARTWWTRAAQAGHADAQNNLGELLADYTDPPELAEARIWYTKAAEAGHADAQYGLGMLLATRLDPPELAMARTWWTKAAGAGHAGARDALERSGNG